MRKFKLLALALVIGTASLFATNIDNPDVPKKEIRNQIINLLNAPEFTVNDDINVNIGMCNLAYLGTLHIVLKAMGQPTKHKKPIHRRGVNESCTISYCD